MLGSLVYITLDVGLNVGMWTTKTLYNSLYYTGSYILGSSDSELETETKTNLKLDQELHNLIKVIEDQKKEISELSEKLNKNN
tara:strand:- start:1918 stop:2166 length:249 start_codon:yes stop_codon:yes gene_type:complete